ncbi:MAG TPA: valine--tRNA ligase [Ktedonobacterales bacterium]|nr:valine--tRNA ligase [Ktedonobacterales bacterium]
MSLSKHYVASEREPEIERFWQESGVYHFDRVPDAPVYSIDTPPPTVSGHLHLGHVYSYTQTDIAARFWRMNGYNVFYPMGFDDNGLPTERLVERRLGVRAAETPRGEFIQACLRVSEEAEREYRRLWSRLGLSVDWRHSYRSIDTLARRTSQQSFLDLYRQGRAYRQLAPTIWCPECRTAIAQAELNDLERESVFYTLAFSREDGTRLPIATTRPELLPACVAVFAHPDDARYRQWIGQSVRVPLMNRAVPLLADELADPAKGTGLVMCCTFGDATDVEWWRTHDLPLRMIVERDGRLTDAAGDYAGLTTTEARARIVADLDAAGLLLARQPVRQTVRVHERCDTPVEYIITRQWFIRVLDAREELLAAGERIEWRPAQMRNRYHDWVENLRWDWCISRQRTFGVAFPVWYCDACGEPLLASDEQLPVDPMETTPPATACACGGTSFTPETDVMDTWATSSMSPQIVGGWLSNPALYGRVFPFSLRPQAHEIIRTWAFDTIVKSLFHFGALPFTTVAISGWGLAPEGGGKISKSKGGPTIGPGEVMEKYSADAARYWAASTGLGKDSVISEEKIALGAKLVTKLWNVARFAERFIAASDAPAEMPALAHSDRWLLSRMNRLVQRVSELYRGYDHAAAKSEIEAFFWQTLCDNYLELAKARLYDDAPPLHEGAVYTLRAALLTTIKLFAPTLPYVTEAMYRELFASAEGAVSLHVAAWPVADETLFDEVAERAGEALVTVATLARRYKSETSLSLGAEVSALYIHTDDPALNAALAASEPDLRSVTRARSIALAAGAGLDDAEWRFEDGGVAVGIVR